MPERIQRKRSKGWRMPENTVYVGRPTKWGNPYIVGRDYIDDENGNIPFDNINAETAVKWFEQAIENGNTIAVNLTTQEIQSELHGKNLACWCPSGQTCHADVLLRLANTAST